MKSENKISRAVSALCSGLLLSAVALLTLTTTAQATNTPPVMSVNTPLFVNQGATVTLGAGNLFASDVESPATGVFFTISSGNAGGPPYSGALMKNGVALGSGSAFTQDDVNNGRITYQHDNSCQTSDQFQFGVTDADGGVYNDHGFTNFSFHINITPVDHPPVAFNGSFTVASGGTNSGTLTATNPDCNPQTLTFSLVGANGGASKGTVTLNNSSTGAYTYAATPGQTGSDSFSFQVSDGVQFATNSGTVTIFIPATPVMSVNAPEYISQGATVTIGSGNLYATDGQNPASAILFTIGGVGLSGTPHSGAVKKNGVTLGVGSVFTQDDVNNGRITYQHDNSCQTSDDFQFGVSNVEGGIYNDHGYTNFNFRVFIASVDHPPVAFDKSFSVGLGASNSGTLTATNPDCNPQTLTFSLVGANGGASKGTVTLNNSSTGAYTYAATPGQTGSDSFSFQVSDGVQFATNSGTVSVSLQNQQPVANASTVNAVQDTVFSGTLTASDVDLPAQTLTYSIVTNGIKGTVSITGSTTGAFTYTPNATRFGTDTFAFKVNDGVADSAPVVVTVAIRPVLSARDILVADQQAPRLMAVDLVTGDQGVISSGGNFIGLRGVAVEATGNILVMDGGTSGPGGGGPAGALLRINPTNGAQSIVVPAASFGFPVSVAVEANGNILVADAARGLRRFTSAGDLLTNFPAGNVLAPIGVTVAPNGQIFVTDGAPLVGHSPSESKLVQIDPVTLAQTVLTTGGNLILPIGVAVETNGNILVTDAAAFFGGPSTVIRVTGGAQTVLATGGSLGAPVSVVVNHLGEIYVANAGAGSVVKLAAVGGAQTPVSSGGILQQPWGIAAYEFPDVSVEQPVGTDLVDGAATIDFGNVIVGNSSAVKTFTVTNSGSAALSGLVVGKDGANAGDFTVSVLGSTTIAPGGSTTFTVTFTPTAGDSRSAVFHLTNNVIGAKNPFDITLTGLAYYTQAQFAANRVAGISDVTNAPNTYGLYTTAQVQTLNLGTPLLQLNPTNGLFTLTIGLQKSTNLVDYSLFPLTAPQVNVNAQGKLDVQFSPAGNAAFFRLQAQ